MTPPERPSLILETSVSALFHTALLFSLYLLFSGHNAPGGGFVGGLVAGAAFVLRFVEHASGPSAWMSRVRPAALLGAGLLVALATAVVPWLGGGELLDHGKVEWDVPLLGTVKATGALPFDIGVYLVVVGLVLMILRTLGQEDAA